MNALTDQETVHSANQIRRSWCSKSKGGRRGVIAGRASRFAKALLMYALCVRARCFLRDDGRRRCEEGARVHKRTGNGTQKLKVQDHWRQVGGYLVHHSLASPRRTHVLYTRTSGCRADAISCSHASFPSNSCHRAYNPSTAACAACISSYTARNRAGSIVTAGSCSKACFCSRIASA